MHILDTVSGYNTSGIKCPAEPAGQRGVLSRLWACPSTALLHRCYHSTILRGAGEPTASHHYPFWHSYCPSSHWPATHPHFSHVPHVRLACGRPVVTLVVQVGA